MSTPSFPTYIITQEPGMVPRRKGPFYGTKMVEGFLLEAYRHDPSIVCIVIDMGNEDNTWYPEHGYEWLDINGDRRKRHPRKDRPKQAAPQPTKREKVLESAAAFLLERIEYFANNLSDVADVNGYYDHVKPALSRLQSCFTAPPAPQPTDETCPCCGGSGHYVDAAMRAINGDIPPTEREKVLEEALRPFANRADRFDGVPPPKYFGDIDCELHYRSETKVHLTVGELRRARAALADKAPSQTDRAEEGV